MPDYPERLTEGAWARAWKDAKAWYATYWFKFPAGGLLAVACRQTPLCQVAGEAVFKYV